MKVNNWLGERRKVENIRSTRRKVRFQTLISLSVSSLILRRWISWLTHISFTNLLNCVWHSFAQKHKYHDASTQTYLSGIVFQILPAANNPVKMFLTPVMLHRYSNNFEVACLCGAVCDVAETSVAHRFASVSDEPFRIALFQPVYSWPPAEYRSCITATNLWRKLRIAKILAANQAG